MNGKEFEQTMLGLIDIRMLVDNDTPTNILIVLNSVEDCWKLLTDMTITINRVYPEYSTFQMNYTYFLREQMYNKVVPKLEIGYRGNNVYVYLFPKSHVYDLKELNISNDFDDVFVFAEVQHMFDCIKSKDYCVYGDANV